MLPRVGQIGEHKFLLQAGGSILMSNDGSISVSVKAHDGDVGNLT